MGIKSYMDEGMFLVSSLLALLSSGTFGVGASSGFALFGFGRSQAGELPPTERHYLKERPWGVGTMIIRSG
ncbi:MAG: hypothetical protein C4576_26440 [Desulfobacteraceae bacterium]|nr:MAG: hypothetical protein C4576_26440 [Desulfobacteraceae bacterium]